jgi:hypothetical protein
MTLKLRQILVKFVKLMVISIVSNITFPFPYEEFEFIFYCSQLNLVLFKLVDKHFKSSQKIV